MTDRVTPGRLRDLADAVQSFDTLLAANLRIEAARREAEVPQDPEAEEMGRLIEQGYRALGFEKKTDAPPPPAPFVTDHKWLDPECHASGCQTLILKAELEKLRDQRDKYMWQVRDTCARAEAAEAREKRLREALLELVDGEQVHELIHDFGVTEERAKGIIALAQGGNDG